METRRLLLLLVSVLTLGNAWAQGPNNSGTYYQAANGKKGEALKTALYGIINGHHKIGYDGLYEAYKKTDTRDDGFVRDWYSKTTKYRHVTDKAGSYSKEGDCYNREHSVPQSWFESHGSKDIIVCDIVHVLPTDGYVNNRRSNHPFGEVSRVDYQSNGGYCKLGSCKTSGYSGTVFEPGEDIKGDLARAYFYMATCYQTLAPKWGHDVFSGSQYNPFSQWAFDMLLRWAKQDPIDEVETKRNNAVYETQKNRNPFVDYPGLEDYIWGDKKNVAFSYDNYEGGGTGSTVAMPIFSKDAGTYYNEVTVELSCATEGAMIYYTTNGSTPTTESTVYVEPIVLTKTTTIRAIAVKDDEVSWTAVATYTIQQTGGGGGGDVTPADAEPGVNNTLFGTSFGGVLGNSDFGTYSGQDNGITITYDKGTGSNQYINNSQIRLYPGNTLTVSVGQGTLTEIEVVSPDATQSKTLQASTGSVNGLVWTGDAPAVTFSVNGSRDHMKISQLKIKVSTPSEPTAINGMPTREQLNGRRVIYNLRGQRVLNPSKGIYIVDGKKVVIE